MVYQRLLEFGLCDLVGAGEDRLEIAELLNELGCRLPSDARDSRHVVDTVPHKSKDITNLVERNAELLESLGPTDPQLVHSIEHVDTGFLVYQLHQVLVGTDDRHFPASLLSRRDETG